MKISIKPKSKKYFYQRAIGLSRLQILLLSIVILVGCSKSDELTLETDKEPPKSDGKPPVGGENPNPEEIGKDDATFIIESDNIVKTNVGVNTKHQFEGVLKTMDGDKETFLVGEGEFSMIVAPDGAIISITGTGMPEFPNVGIFKDILSDFDWEPVLSHIEYQTGAYYKETYSIENIPLEDDIHYLHFSVFDENKDEKEQYGLRQFGNTVIYNFFDLYIDINDPAVFFKIPVWIPKKPKKGGVAEKFWDKAKERVKILGNSTLENAMEFIDSPNLVVGISKQGTFEKPEYKFGLKNSEVFNELYGFDRLEALNANLYLGLNGVPIPYTGVIQYTGEQYIHNSGIDELGLQGAALDWLNETISELSSNSASTTYFGSLDFGGNGLAVILLGILPNVNDFFGRDIFEDDINIVLTEAFSQIKSEYAIGGGFENLISGSYSMGGSSNTARFFEFFGDDYKKYVASQPDVETYYFLNVEGDSGDGIAASLYLETAVQLLVPLYGPIDFFDGHFLISEEGINFGSQFDQPVGPITFSQEITGELTKDGFELTSHTDRNVTIPVSEVELTTVNLDINISSLEGISVSGEVGLPFGLGNVGIGNGQIVEAGMEVAETLNTGLTFNGVTLQISNGQLIIDPNNGLSINGSFALPAGLFSAQMSGVATSSEILLKGQMGTGIEIGGHRFPISNSNISASTLAGVTMNYTMDLGPYNAAMSGRVNPNGTFLLTGSNGFSRGIDFAGISAGLSGTINVRVTNSEVVLSGSGSVSYTGLLGNSINLYSGPLSFNPNWATGTIEVCASGFCTSI